MTKTTDYFAEEFEKQRRKYERIKPGNIAYGSNVMPILQMYKDLSVEERKYYREALENLLADPNANRRRYAIDICLGFFIFRDVT